MFYLLSQDKHSTCESYLNIVDVIEHCGESLGRDAGVIKKKLKKDGKDISAGPQRTRYTGHAKKPRSSVWPGLTFLALTETDMANSSKT
jgi:hypothetical protein